MKTILLMLTMLLFLHSGAVHGKPTEWAAGDATANPGCLAGPQEVKAYFVRGSFTSDEVQMLWRTLETWTSSVAPLTIRFLNAGETGGLIDCLGCLTLTRQAVYTNDQKRQVSFNRLRGDQTGRLISAWIGFDSAITDSQKLKRMLIQVLAAEALPGETCKDPDLR